ncbi:GTP-binding protein [Methanobacterium alcaliphilum]|uniref:ATP-binding protein n=1 Tax=Methanobacterium alcaliphilum TaxID=392018 RepID=UPI00200B2039|nr:GTP-binding protein [Methanobacterium alcaliphilum]MCK9151699.1 GTP-binding protein [Methanobacterium alcaliphilum]
MKIVICGKGGSGKSTIASLLAKSFEKNANSVLVIDTDESNFGLHRQLGVELPQDFINYLGGKNIVLEKIMNASPNWDSISFFEKSWQIDDIPSEYYSQKEKIRLMAIGKIHEVGEGCACTMGMVAQEFISNLKLKSDEIVIIDTEAGIEHFGRSMEKDVDVIIMIIDPSYESMKLSEKVVKLSKNLDKPVYFVLNKIDELNEKFLRNTINNEDIIIAAIPSNTNLTISGLKGNEIMTEFSEIQKIEQFLKERHCVK